MASKRRALWIAVAIVVCAAAAAVVAVRLILTPEKLMAIVLPRVEKLVDAKVTVGGIKVNFPFGFGVDIADLRFAKTLPDTTALDFSSETVTVRASLLSLIKRKPEITAASVRGGEVALVNEAKDREIELRGLEALFSVKPAGELFDLRTRMRVDSITIARAGMPPAVSLEEIALSGEIETDRSFARVAIKDARLLWSDLLSMRVTGEVVDAATAPRFDLSIQADEKPLGPLLEALGTFRLADLSPDPKSSAAPAAAPQAKLEGGAMKFSARIEGLAREPLRMKIAFEANLDGAALRGGELATIERIDARIAGSGDAATLRNLMPESSRPEGLSEIGRAWREIGLEGTIEVSGGEFLANAGSATPGGTDAPSSPPLRISALKAKAEIAGPDVNRVSGDFSVGGSPFTFSGSFANIMPAVAELALIARHLAESGDPAPIADLGPYLDGMANSPVIRFEASGRSFDARPYQKPRDGKKPVSTAPVSGSGQAAGGAGAVLLLKNTAFTAKLDSLIVREAILTAVEAKGTIANGRVRIEPVTFGYAGGTGAATVASDVRRPSRVESAIDFSLRGVEAGEALGRLVSLGTLVRGRFNVDSKATIVTGKGIDPFAALSAAGSALSTNGSVNFEKYLESLSAIQNFDASPITSFDFSDWKGTFQVQDGRFVTDDWRIASSAGAWAIKGSFGLDGSLDYLVHLSIPPAVQQRMKNIDAYKSALDLMRDGSGNLVLDIRVTGNSKHPSAMLDLTKAKGKAQDKVMEGLKKLIR